MHLSNLFANLRGSWLHKRLLCKVKFTKFNKNIIKLLWVLGYIQGFYFLSLYKLQIRLKINEIFIKNILMISKSGRRIYCNLFFLNNLIKLNKGIYLLSTNKGLLTHQGCKFWHVGGELIRIIY